MGASRYNETIIKLNGKTLAVPRKFFDVAVKASFDQNPQANLTSDSFTFVLNAAKEIRAHVDSGLKSGVGIFEGMPLEISATGRNNSISVFKGILDLQDSMVINDELGQIEVKIKQDSGLNNLEDALEALDFGFLLEIGVIKESDYINIDYVVIKIDSTLEAITMLITIFLLAKQLIDSIKSLSEQIGTIAGLLGSSVTGILGSVIFAIAVAIAEVIFAAAILALIVKLGAALLELLIQPKRTHKAISLKKLLEKTCEHIGYGFNTTIQDLDNVVYLPSNITTDDYGDSIFIQIPGTIKQGIPNVTDFGYTCTELFALARMLFNGRFLIDKNTVEFHTESSDFWIKRATWIKPDVLRTQGFRFNTDEILSSININFQTDITDEYTIQEFKGTVFQVLTDAKTIINVRNKTIKNAEQVSIPCALGTRKERLNGFEKLLAEMAGVFDEIAKTFGGNSNLKDRITEKVGVLKVSFNNHAVPKLLWLEGNRMPSNHRELFSAKTLWDKYHVEKSFVQNNFQRQRAIFENERIPFGFDDFTKVVNNSYFHDTEGKLGKMIILEWTMNKDFAIISYWHPQVYTKNLKETFIEP